MKTEKEIRGTIALLEAYIEQDIQKLMIYPIHNVEYIRTQIATNQLVAAYLKDIVRDDEGHPG